MVGKVPPKHAVLSQVVVRPNDPLRLIVDIRRTATIVVEDAIGPTSIWSGDIFHCVPGHGGEGDGYCRICRRLNELTSLHRCRSDVVVEWVLLAIEPFLV